MTASTASERQLVSQIELARDLNLTDRRIRQLITERILPPAREAGFDLELCRQLTGCIRTAPTGIGSGHSTRLRIWPGRLHNL